MEEPDAGGPGIRRSAHPDIVPAGSALGPESSTRNVLDRRSWKTRDELRIAIVTWIERTYHRRRRQAALGRLTPIEYETIMTPQTAAAA